MFYVPSVSGMLFQEVLVLQVQYMIDSKNGGSLVYSNVCGLMVYRYMIKRLASKSNMPMSNAYTGDITYIVM
jgi:hypothetical protein